MTEKLPPIAQILDGSEDYFVAFTHNPIDTVRAIFPSDIHKNCAARALTWENADYGVAASFRLDGCDVGLRAIAPKAWSFSGAIVDAPDSDEDWLIELETDFRVHSEHGPKSLVCPAPAAILKNLAQAGVFSLCASGRAPGRVNLATQETGIVQIVDPRGLSPYTKAWENALGDIRGVEIVDTLERFNQMMEVDVAGQRGHDAKLWKNPDVEGKIVDLYRYFGLQV